MDFVFVGWPAIIFLVGFVVVFSMPVWLAARIIGAKRPTLGGAIVSLATGMLVLVALTVLVGPWGFVLAPVGYLLAFKYILGTSFLGAVGLAVVAGIGYLVLGYLFSGYVPGIPGIPAVSSGVTI